MSKNLERTIGFNIMSGFYGIISEREELGELINRMCVPMQNHGRAFFSHAELFSFADKHAALGGSHKSSSAQEMHVATNGVRAFLYGNLYNRDSLCKELDCCREEHNNNSALLAKAYNTWALKCFSKFNGAYVAVIFDPEQEAVFIAKDKVGKKPLYYSFSSTDFVFATDLFSLQNFPTFQKEVDRSVLARFFRLGFIPAPDTIFCGVRKLSGGMYLQVAKNNIHEFKYWNLNDEAHHAETCMIRDYREAEDRLRSTLRDVVRARLNPCGANSVFLSSGIDSSLVAAIAQEQLSGTIDTYTIGVADPQYNEGVLARNISEQLHARHTEVFMSDDELLAIAENLPDYYDEPFGDVGMLPNCFLCQLVGKKAAFALGGDGGDEVFGGYPHYRALIQAQRFDKIGSFLNLLPKSITRRFPNSVRRVIANRNPATKCQMIMPDDVLEIEGLLLHKGQEPFYPTEEDATIKNWVFRRMLLDMRTTLVDDMIYKAERAAGSAGMDVRSPLLDDEVISLSLRIPIQFKHSSKQTKIILRNLAYQYIPRQLLDVPKRGFTIPIENWLRGQMREVLDYFSSPPFIEQQGVFRVLNIKNLLSSFYSGDSRKTTLCFRFLMFQMWYAKHIKQY